MGGFPDWLKVVLSYHLDSPKLLSLKEKVAVVDVLDVLGVGFDFHVHDLLDHRGRRVGFVAVVVEQIQPSERRVLLLG